MFLGNIFSLLMPTCLLKFLVDYSHSWIKLGFFSSGLLDFLTIFSHVRFKKVHIIANGIALKKSDSLAGLF
jgi:hypothetical protein